ncbi:MAG TPA: gamma carbonic anhydrase family protein [Victivallales bacterium]|nr:gamma carbonic anhydrase family protein [Victivallales bacterium]
MKHITPIVHETAFIAEGAKIVGGVTIKKEASVWYNSVIRSDIPGTEIIIGERTNIQDGTVVHVEFGVSTYIGNDVTIGHNCIIHGCTIEDGCLIGMGAIILSGAYIKKGSIIGAGAVVKENSIVEAHTLMVGIPAKEAKKLADTSQEIAVENCKKYLEKTKRYKNNEYGIYK